MIPLDTHIARISSYIGLTNLKARAGPWPSISRAACGDWIDRPPPIRLSPFATLGLRVTARERETLRKCFACPIKPFADYNFRILGLLYGDPTETDS